jgi:hypothetical protein
MNPTAPQSWLVLFNPDNADSVTWVQWYRTQRSIPHRNLLPLSGLPASETLNSTEWSSVKDQVTTYIATNRLAIAGIIIGYRVPGLVTLASTVSLASLLAKPGASSLNESNPAYQVGVTGSRDWNATGRYLVGEINAFTLAEAQALTTSSKALSTVAAAGELIGTLNPQVDRLGMSATGWTLLDNWIGTLAQQRLAIKRATWDATTHGHAIELTSATTGAFSITGQRKALIVTVGTSSASSLWTSSTLMRSAVTAGYAYGMGQVTTAGNLPDPAPMLAVLRRGGTWAEAVIASVPTLGSSWRCVGDPLGLMPTPRQAFGLYCDETDNLLAVAPDDEPFELALANLLGDGNWTLSLVRSNQYGTLSDPATHRIKVSSGGTTVAQPPRLPVNPRATQIAGGSIRLRWSLTPGTDFATPTRYDIDEASDPGTVLTTLAGDAQAATPAVNVGPFTNGRTVRLRVRSVTDGTTGDWIEALPAVADDQAPEPPTIL